MGMKITMQIEKGKKTGNVAKKQKDAMCNNHSGNFTTTNTFQALT